MRLRKKIPSLALTLSQQFHEQTKIKKIPHELPMEKWPDSWKKVTFKGYPRFSALRLSKPKKMSVKFSEVLDKRKSTRKYSPIALDEPKLSSLLYHVAGIREKNEFMQANRFYPSSKTCFNCGYIHKELKRNDRVYVCPKCNNTIDRDLNASINLENLKEYKVISN